MENLKKHILLIEDDQSIVQMYSTKFQEKYDVTTASTGVEGLEAVKTSKPDIILLDIIIPQMDGFAVLEKLKSDPTTKDIPVLLLTNLGQDSDKGKGESLGAVGYMVKAEYTPTQVLERIASYLNN